MSVFGSFPSWWVRRGALREGFMGGQDVGEKIATLKIVLAVSLLCDFHTREVSLSVSDLETITGLSRPMVIRGVRRGSDYGLLTASGEYRFTYKLLTFPGDTGWAKVPKAYLFKELQRIPNRGMVVLVALKLYIQLLADRPNQATEYSMTHDTIVAKLGVQPKHVRPALDVLFNHNLLSISTEQIPDGRRRVMNKYKIRGLS